MAKQKETILQRYMRKAVTNAFRDVFSFKVHGNAFQKKGLPDLHFTIAGLSIWVETKVGKNELSGVQLTRIRELRKSGALAFASKNTEYTLKRIRRYLRRKNAEDYIIQIPEEGRKADSKKKKGRIVYGARDWENHSLFSSDK